MRRGKTQTFELILHNGVCVAEEVILRQLQSIVLRVLREGARGHMLLAQA